MKVVVDTCVLYPTVMREMLLGVAAIAGWTPLWSVRILEEWALAARKNGPTGELQARAEITLTKKRWPKAEVTWEPSLEASLWLPDENDRHVLAAAVASSADFIVTLNVSDFPQATLRNEGLDRIDPDNLLIRAHQKYSKEIRELGLKVTADASLFFKKTLYMPILLKKARLPRLARALR